MRLSPKEDLSGRKFGRLTVISFDGLRKRKGRCWLCRCDCGNEKIIRGTMLNTGNTKSCGCIQREYTRNMGYKNTTHGQNRVGKMSTEYRAWGHMISRCENPNVERYNNYGGRGITICRRWRESFEAFFEDMGYKPDKSYTIERIDVNGNYEPSNCRWATKKEQQRNTTRTRWVEYNGVRQSLAEWRDQFGLKQNDVYYAARKNSFDMNKALNELKLKGLIT